MATHVVRAVLTNNQTLSGTFTTPDGVVLVAGDIVLAAAQSLPSANGLYTVVSGAPWTRTSDISYEGGMEVRIREGNNYAWTLWMLKNTSAITLDVTAQVWDMIERAKFYSIGAGLTLAGDDVRVADTGVVAGTWELPTLVVNSRGQIVTISSGALGSAYIEGLLMRYVSGTQFAVDIGAAYIPGLDRVVTLTAAQTVTPAALANGVYYVYLTEVNGTGQIVTSTTAPAAEYFGTARTQTGDETRRYIGMVRMDTAGTALVPFQCILMDRGTTVFMQYTPTPQENAVIRALNAVTGNTTLNTVDIGHDSATAALRLVSPGCRSARVYCVLTTAASAIGYPTPDTADPPIALPIGSIYRDIPLSSNNEFKYKHSATTAVLSVYISGYQEKR